ncbi:MAG TPA: glycosyltransferase, partial [Bacteroidetes bacterium]|nr:glycosyltransferase [Bacteroidota bacterium]
MNILFVNSIGRKKFGGGEKWMVKAAGGLQNAGHRVFLASKRNSLILQAAEKEGVPTQVFNIRADFSPLNTWRIARFLRRERIDVLVCNLNKDVRVAGLAARLLRHGPVVIARHGIVLCGKKWKHKVTLTHLVDGILTNSESIKRTYAGYGWFPPDFVRVIYNGVELKSGVQPFPFEERFPGKKVILAAGRLTEQKGFDYLIGAAALLRRKRQDLVFVIAGTGRLEAHLRSRIRKLHLEDTVELWGFRRDLDSLMAGAVLFVLSSTYEGMPNVVMEAMALGKPVVATDVNGVRELMVDGETGRIVPPRDSAALARAIEEVIDSPGLLRRYGEA